LYLQAYWHEKVPNYYKVAVNAQTKVPKVETLPNYKEVLFRPIEDFIYNARGNKDLTQQVGAIRH
jgi:hypothetical protein